MFKLTSTSLIVPWLARCRRKKRGVGRRPSQRRRRGRENRAFFVFFIVKSRFLADEDQESRVLYLVTRGKAARARVEGKERERGGGRVKAVWVVWATS